MLFNDLLPILLWVVAWFIVVFAKVFPEYQLVRAISSYTGNERVDEVEIYLVYLLELRKTSRHFDVDVTLIIIVIGYMLLIEYSLLSFTSNLLNIIYLVCGGLTTKGLDLIHLPQLLDFFDELEIGLEVYLVVPPPLIRPLLQPLLDLTSKIFATN